jgi:RNA polymerase sigma-70 factor (ECF subfamily)
MMNNLPDQVQIRAQVEDMFQSYRRLIYDYVHKCTECNNEQAEDLTNEVFERAQRSLKGGSGPTGPPKNWLIKVAKNVCLRFLEKERPNLHNSLSLDRAVLINGEERLCLDRAIDNDHNPERIVEQRQLYEALSEAMKELPSHMQEAVKLYICDGWTLAAISRLSNRSPGKVKRDVQKGIEKLRGRLIQE